MEKAESKDSAPKETSTFGTTAPAQDVPDPEEDDLDDLEGRRQYALCLRTSGSNLCTDMLDEFQASKLDDPKHAPQTARAEDFQELDISDAAADEFSKQLQEQMAALMGSVDESPEMRKEIEAMMKELGAATDPGPSADQPTQSKDGPKAKAPATTTSEEPFQSTIRKTMQRMQASSSQATAATAQSSSDDPEDLLASMLKEMQNGGLDGAGGAGADEEGFNKMLMGMMEQLTNKEILYEPMKELHVKFPGWMRENRAKTKKEDLERYEEQQRLVGEIVGRFEMKGYSDERAEDKEFIVERMQLVCI